MPRFLIQLTHEDEHKACILALGAIERYGSHFVTNADWGCKAGVHSGWLTVELDSEEEAMRMVPPEFRGEATIIKLNRFDKKEIQNLLDSLDG